MAIGFSYEKTFQNSAENDSSVEFSKNIIIPREFTNAICYGQTGTGKTSGFVLPNIKARMESGDSLVIYAFKGNLHEQVKELAKECGRLGDVVEIGVAWGDGINLLKEIDKNDFEVWYKDVAGSNKNPYWSTASYALFVAIRNVYEMISSVAKKEKKMTFLSAYKKISVCDKYNVSMTFRDITNFVNIKGIEKIYEDAKIIHNILSHSKNDEYLVELNVLTKALNTLENYQNVKECDPGSGNSAVMETLSNTICLLGEHDCLNTSGSLDDIFSKNAILIIHAEAVSLEASRLLNVCIFKRLFNRFGGADEPKNTAIFIDEAHKIITKNSMPETSVCRESRFEYILSTQNPQQLINVIGHDNFIAIEQNIAHKLGFFSPDIPECERLKKFECVYLPGSKNGGEKVLAKPIFLEIESLKTAQKEYFKQNELIKKVIVMERDFKEIDYIKPSNDENIGILVRGETELASEIIRADFKDKIYQNAMLIKQEASNIEKKYNYEAVCDYNYDDEFDIDENGYLVEKSKAVKIDFDFLK